MIRAEHRRLTHLFGLLLAYSQGGLLAPLALTPSGCSTKEMPADATAPGDTTIDDQASSPADADAGVMIDAGEDVFCGVGVTLLDAADPDAADADPGCEYSFPCGLPDGTVLVGCDLYAPGTGPLDARAFGCWVAEGHGCSDGAIVPADGNVIVDCKDCLGGAGRGSSGVAILERVRARSLLGAYFAKMAHDEAASIWAFERFERELGHHGAPRSLLRAARSARRDEIVHARMMASHARRLGTEIRAPRIRKSKRARSLEAIAKENAIEGCVRETFGALIASLQARDAAPEHGKTFDRIAADETRHAALAHAAARWMDSHLSLSARIRVARARRAAATELLSRPSVAAVVRRFFGDDDVVHVALAKTLRGDAHEV